MAPTDVKSLNTKFIPAITDSFTISIFLSLPLGLLLLIKVAGCIDCFRKKKSLDFNEVRKSYYNEACDPEDISTGERIKIPECFPERLQALAAKHCSADQTSILEKFLSNYKNKIFYGEFDQNGGSLDFGEDLGIQLTIPRDALEGPQLVYVIVTLQQCHDMSHNISSVYECGPDGLQFKVPVDLKIPHCSVGGDFAAAHKQSTSDQWQFDKSSQVTIKEKTETSVTLQITHFTAFKLIQAGSTGHVAPHSVGKKLSFALFCKHKSLRLVFTLGNSKCLLQNCVEKQRADGYLLISDWLDFIFYVGRGALVIQANQSKKLTIRQPSQPPSFQEARILGLTCDDCLDIDWVDSDYLQEVKIFQPLIPEESLKLKPKTGTFSKIFSSIRKSKKLSRAKAVEEREDVAVGLSYSNFGSASIDDCATSSTNNTAEDISDDVTTTVKKASNVNPIVEPTSDSKTCINTSALMTNEGNSPATNVFEEDNSSKLPEPIVDTSLTSAIDEKESSNEVREEEEEKKTASLLRTSVSRRKTENDGINDSGFVSGLQENQPVSTDSISV